jgi:hypothetical protein
MSYWGSPGRLIGVVAPLSTVLISPPIAQNAQVVARASRTQIVLLGRENPPGDPDHSGPATAIVVDGTPYLVYFGAGVVRRAKAAVADRGITALEPTNWRVVFVTHLHSDHTVGYRFDTPDRKHCYVPRTPILRRPPSTPATAATF